MYSLASSGAVAVDHDTTVRVIFLKSGAIKLARTLYEKTLTLAYLARHVDEIKDFVDYSSVHWHKLVIEGAVASPDGENWIPQDEREQIERNYAAVRERYLTTDCKTCKTKRPMGSWTKKSGPEMANATHPVFRGMYFNGFLAPTLAIHPTFTTMATQCEVKGNKMGFNRDVLRQDNETAFGVAIAMLFTTIVTMDEFFGLGRNDLVTEVTERFAAFNEAHPFGPPAG